MDIIALIVLAGIVAACVFDFVVFLLRGYHATISWTLLRLEANRPVFGPLVAYTLSTLTAHLTIPTHAPPLGWWAIVLGLSPIAAGLAMLAAFGWLAKGEPATWLDGWLRRRRMRWAACIAGASVLGFLSGVFLVPQHVG